MKAEDCVRGCADGYEHYGPCSTGGASEREEADRLERYHRNVLADLNKEAQRPDKTVPRQRFRW